MKSYAFQLIRLLHNDVALNATQKALVADLTFVMSDLKGSALVNGLIDFAEYCHSLSDKHPWYACVGSIAVMFAEMANREEHAKSLHAAPLNTAQQEWNESMLTLEYAKLVSDIHVRVREMKRAARQLSHAHDIFSRQGKDQDAQLCMIQLQQAEKTLYQLQGL